MKKFRDKEVIGWRIVESMSKMEFDTNINDLMDKYDFIDFQFSTAPSHTDRYGIVYTAAILIAEK